MRTLDAAALDTEPITISPTDIQLVLQAERWLYQNGWEPHHVRGWSNVGRAFGVEEGCNGLWIRERRRGFWDGTGTRHPVRSVLAGLNVLVNEEILPARFSTYGRQALADYAEALDRSATRMAEEDGDDSHVQAQVDALRYAAEVARNHDPVAVFA